MTETTPANTGPAPKKSNKRTLGLLLLTAVFLTIGIIWFIYWLIWARFSVSTEDAYVGGNLVQIMSQVSGTVTEINTDDTRPVKKGQVLVKLDSADTDIGLSAAAANLAQTVRQLRQSFEDTNRAQAALASSSASLNNAQQDYDRRAKLVTAKLISHEELQHYQTALKAAKAENDVTLHSLRSSQALIANTHLYTHPLVERAKAAYRTAYLNASRTSIMAPIDGFVAKRSVQVGQQITSNTPLMAIIPLTAIWVEANYKESQLNELRINQPATVTADAYPDIEFHGKVYGLGAGTGAAFSLLPPQNATGNWIKIVQRLPVRISLDPQELIKHPLQIGISMQVDVDTHDQSGQRLAAPVADNKSFYSTAVYENALKDANNHIEKILQENAPNLAAPSANQ